MVPRGSLADDCVHKSGRIGIQQTDCAARRAIEPRERAEQALVIGVPTSSLRLRSNSWPTPGGCSVVHDGVGVEVLLRDSKQPGGRGAVETGCRQTNALTLLVEASRRCTLAESEEQLVAGCTRPATSSTQARGFPAEREAAASMRSGWPNVSRTATGTHFDDWLEQLRLQGAEGDFIASPKARDRQELMFLLETTGGVRGL